ncbi:hypothetical protein BGX23_000973 [Mortierella sp. AD031]|nr:hypothetical protein BGX23_000973 [Mortierella sp. AD031]KAG0198166.1 hypothetical protein BGX33_012537 [Mortierella sp. NVP41]
MATFHSLSPSLGSHQSRLAPDLFSIELELALPQDHFLPAEDIQAQVWTNIIHKLNPDGPEVWAALPMKLSHVIPGKSIAVFAARFQPTGRGDFGLTARWKSHRDLTEWQWAPTEIPVNGGDDKQQGNKTNNNNNNNVSGGDEVKKNRDVSVRVRVPRTIAGTSSWTIGPQSVLVYGEHGPRVSGVVGVGGPGLYLGNHAAATRARISGYESVLSLVGDLLDFDEKIPESDKDINKNAWIEQAQAASPPKRFSVLSRSSSINALDASDAEGYPQQQTNIDGTKGPARRSSVTDFMRNYIPGSNAEAIIAAVVDEPIDPPRLTRKSSVTDMMVQAPSTSSGSASSKRLTRSSASVSSIASIDEFDAEKPVTVTTASALPPNPAAKNGATRANNASGKDLNKKASLTSVATPPIPAPAATTTTTPTPTPQVSKKAQKRAAAAEAAAAAAALPPVSAGKRTRKTATTGSTTEATSPSPTVNSLAVTPASSSATAETPHPLDASSSVNPFTHTLASQTSSDTTTTPTSSGKVASGLYRQSFDSSQILADLVTNTNTTHGKKKIPFNHKVISLAPGAHNRISDAILKEAIEFLQQELDEGKKVLVHCRDGNGRSGSIAVAYIATQLQKKDPQRDRGEVYDQALNEIWKWKCDVYPHKGLRQSVERIQW